MAVGSIPNTAGIGLEEAGVQLTESGHIRVNRVARTSMPNIYAAGDCTTFLPLASVASMQGRTAVFHAMGDVVDPPELRNITSNIFTQPEIATVGWTAEGHRGRASSTASSTSCRSPSNPRAKMMGIKDGFVKLFARSGIGHRHRRRHRRPRRPPSSSSRSRSPSSTGSPSTSLAEAFPVYPSLSGAHHGCRARDARRTLRRRGAAGAARSGLGDS